MDVHYHIKNDENLYFSQILALPAGETCRITGSYGVEYEFLKNQLWDGTETSMSNTVQIVAYHEGKTLASVDKEAWLSSEHFDINKILEGREPMIGAVTGKQSCPIEELRAKGVSLDLDPTDAVLQFLDLTEFSLHCCTEPETPRINDENEDGKWWLSDEQNGWDWVSGERFDDADGLFNTLDSCFTDYITDALEREWDNSIDCITDVDGDEIEKPQDAVDWANFLEEYDTPEAFDDFKNTRKAWNFIQQHRFDLELCDIWSNRCEEVDLDKAYKEMRDGVSKDRLVPYDNWTSAINGNGEYQAGAELIHNDELNKWIQALRKDNISPLLARTADRDIIVFAHKTENGHWKLDFSVPTGENTSVCIDADNSINLEDEKLLEQEMSKVTGFKEYAFTLDNKAVTMSEVTDMMSFAQDCNATYVNDFKNLNGYDISVRYKADKDDFDFVISDTQTKKDLLELKGISAEWANSYKIFRTLTEDNAIEKLQKSAQDFVKNKKQIEIEK